ncbi:MAG: FtsW/RodA/SpoVE family cell cycle protein, partial [Hyphomonadaceae bacterium]
MIAQLARRLESYDRALLVAASMLLGAGAVLALAASPAVSAKLDYADKFGFAWRHFAFAGAGVGLFALSASFSPRGVRRFSGVLFCIAMMAMLLVLLVGEETKGAQRWLRLGPMSMQPSEFMKPALVVLMAWMLSEWMRRRTFPGVQVAMALYAAAAVLLLAQPDVGQTTLLAACFAILLFAAGVHWLWMAGGLAAAGVFGWALYFIFPHVRARVDAFMQPETASYQVQRALDAISAGGVLGRGAGEGVFKRRLPDAHSDFIYAVSAEEFGLLASIGFIALYGAIAWRGFDRAQRLADPFAQ